MSLVCLRVRWVAIVVALIAFVVVPAATCAAVDAPSTTAASAPAQDEAVDEAPVDAVEPPPTESVDEGTEQPDESEAAADESGEPSGSAVTSQANADTRQMVEAVLAARKVDFDGAANKLQRNINQLAAIVRRLDAAGVNASSGRKRLSEARTALNRAKAAERVTSARYRAVLNADDATEAYAAARAAARSSSTLLERARVKVLTATRTLRAIVKNATIQNEGSSTDST